MDLNEEIESKRVGSDSMSALTISAGNGSWRTRHLRLKAAWLQEKIGSNEVEGYHVPGQIQPADLLTKALPGQRIRDLLRLWNLVGDGLEAATSSRGGVSKKMLVALLCCLMITMASGQPEREVARILIDWDMAGVCMILLMILGALVVWEGLKWGCVQIYHEYLPGATKRKLRRLQKIRDATALAIQRELERIGNEPAPLETPQGDVGQPPTSTSTSGRPSIRASTYESGRARPHAVMDEQQRSTPRSQPALEVRTPPPTRRNQPWESPGIAESSGIDFSPREEGQFEDDRVCNDVLLLLTVDHLREGLRHEGLMTSGLKNDLSRRLADRLVTLMRANNGPTIRQLKYVLWIWRHGNVSGRYQLRWSDVNNRTRTSNFIHAWKDR